ncbi:MAG: hypothetical protein ACK4OP_00380 [Gemmobacter sp.]
MTLAEHFEVANAGAFVVLRPISDAARDWCDANLPEPDQPGAWHVEARYLGPILEGAARDLLPRQ